MISKINSLFGCIIATLYFAAPVYSQDAKLIEAGKKKVKWPHMDLLNPIMLTQSFRFLRKNRN